MRVFSAMQPSGSLHLGNYFGSMKPNLAMSVGADESFFFIVDLHALTTLQDPGLLRQFRQDAALDYLAVGFDPDKTVMCFQSYVPQHTELMWILSTVTPTGLLERAVSYKEKVEKGIPASTGLFTYPVLMAADILLYDADVVPVGKDQKQHLEMTRDIAMKFNHTFGETLVIPEVSILEDVAVVPGIDGQKMSKSYGNTIPLFATDAQLKKAVMGIVTDSKGSTDPKDPDKSVIFQIHRLFLTPSEQQEVADAYRNGLSYGDAKKRLLSTIMDALSPMRKKREELAAKKGYVEQVMIEGAKKAQAVAEKTMEKVRVAVGIR